MADRYDRREFLRRAGVLTAAAALGRSGPRLAAHPDPSLAPFYHGVASGDPKQRRVILWTRVSPDGEGPVSVTWRVSTDPDLTTILDTGIVTTDSSRDFTVKVDLKRLDPATTYFYEFEAYGRRSIVGRTRTLPRGNGVDALRFGVVSCANYEGGYFNAYARLADRNDLDAIIHLGDYIYEYAPGEYGPGPSIGRTHEPPNETIELAHYRSRYAQYHLDPDLRRLHQLYPFIHTLDDHEAADNAWTGGAGNHQPSEGDWEARKRAARQANLEWLPIRIDDPSEPLYRSFGFGSLADLFVLDTRLDGRDEQVDPDLPLTIFSAETNDPDRNLISDAQRTWLHEGVAESEAGWKIVAQQVMMMQWNAGGLPLLPERPDVPRLFRDGGNAVNPDAWDGYTAERSRLFERIRSAKVENFVVLTGDVHTSWAADLTEDPYDPTRYDPVSGEGALGVEFVTPSITSDNFNEILGVPEGSSLPFEVAIRADNPHIRYVDLDRHGYVVLDVAEERVQASWFFIRTRREPDEIEYAGPSFEVRRGDNHLRRTVVPLAVRAMGTRPAGLPRARLPLADENAAPSSFAVTAGLIGGLVGLRMRVEDDPEE